MYRKNVLLKTTLHNNIYTTTHTGHPGWHVTKYTFSCYTIFQFYKVIWHERSTILIKYFYL